MYLEYESFDFREVSLGVLQFGFHKDLLRHVGGALQAEHRVALQSFWNILDAS